MNSHGATPAIDIAELVKTFGATRALDGLNLRLAEGEIRGFLGPNGSGKSTAIRIALGLIRKTSGDVRLFGKEPWSHASELHRRLAYVPGEVSLWPGLTGGECIDVLGLAGPPVDPKRKAELLDRFDLDPTKKFRDYSKGNRQKVALVAALATRCDLLILDEPTSGLDPLMESVFRQIVKERSSEGTAILLSSHILSEVDALCERVTIIRQGRVVQSGSISELRALSRTTVHAVVAGPAPEMSAPSLGDVEATPTPTGTAISFSVNPADIEQAMRPLIDAGVSSLTVRPPTLDELFMNAYTSSATTP